MWVVLQGRGGGIWRLRRGVGRAGNKRENKKGRLLREWHTV